jgi:signal peptidase I
MTKAIKITGWLITAVLILFIAGLAFIRFSPGYSFSVVRSGSMTPTFRMGDVIITRPLAGNIEPGMIIMYQHGDETISHRVLSVNGDTLVMKGDTLINPDPWQVTVSSVRGVYLFKIPYIGYAVSFIRTKLGWFLSIIIPAVVIVGGFIMSIFKEAVSRKPDELNVVK